MKQKRYDFDPKKHDTSKLTKAFYCGMRVDGKFRPNVAEVNNPHPAFDSVEFEGDQTLDERIKDIVARQLGMRAAALQAQSVETIEEALDFDIDETEFEDQRQTVYETLGGIDVQALKNDDSINKMDVDLSTDDQTTSSSSKKEPKAKKTPDKIKSEAEKPTSSEDEK